MSSIQVRGVQATFEEENCWSGTGSLAGSHWVDATTGGPAWGRSLDSPGELTGGAFHPSTLAWQPGLPGLHSTFIPGGGSAWIPFPLRSTDGGRPGRGQGSRVLPEAAHGQ